MAITGTHKFGNYDGVDRQTYTTDVLTPQANKLYLLFIVGARVGNTAVLSSVTGGGLTWTNVRISESGTDRSVSLWRALSASPGAPAAISIQFTTSINACAWSLWEFDGIDTGGTNGENAIVQSRLMFGGGSSTSIEVSLAAFANGANRPFIGIWHNRDADITLEGGYTGGGTFRGNSPNTSICAGWNPTTADTTPSGSWSGGVSSRAIGVELAAAPSAGPSMAVLANYYRQLRV